MIVRNAGAHQYYPYVRTSASCSGGVGYEIYNSTNNVKVGHAKYNKFKVITVRVLWVIKMCAILLLSPHTYKTPVKLDHNSQRHES